jgi:hypothetical protein
MFVAEAAFTFPPLHGDGAAIIGFDVCAPHKVAANRTWMNGNGSPRTQRNAPRSSTLAASAQMRRRRGIVTRPESRAHGSRRPTASFRLPAACKGNRFRRCQRPPRRVMLPGARQRQVVTRRVGTFAPHVLLCSIGLIAATMTGERLRGMRGY